MYFKVLKNKPAEGEDIWAYEKRDPSLFTVEGMIRDMMLADGYAEVEEAEYIEEVAEGSKKVVIEEAAEEAVE